MEINPQVIRETFEKDQRKEDEKKSTECNDRIIDRLNREEFDNVRQRVKLITHKEYV